MADLSRFCRVSSTGRAKNDRPVEVLPGFLYGWGEEWQICGENEVLLYLQNEKNITDCISRFTGKLHSRHQDRRPCVCRNSSGLQPGRVRDGRGYQRRHGQQRRPQPDSRGNTGSRQRHHLDNRRHHQARSGPSPSGHDAKGIHAERRFPTHIYNQAPEK